MSRRDPLAGIAAVSIGNDRPSRQKEEADRRARLTAPPPPSPPLSASVPESPESPPVPAPVEPPPKAAPAQQTHSPMGKLGAALGGIFRRKKS